MASEREGMTTKKAKDEPKDDKLKDNGGGDRGERL
jgi:hypothetical protein